MMIKKLLIVGDVNNPCKKDVPESTTIKALLDGYAGGIKNNKKVNQIPRVYGGIDFLIYFKKELIGQAGIHNTNWWHTHEFLFDFFIVTLNEFC